ncbi:hypothetical protein [Amycolatopsis pigmentata]|uniref:Uncharacterized protein n=1 Tax=Amycolatopsis pigmentata TaxID=450801 RepID=A0ABW5G360_9PSEU
MIEHLCSVLSDATLREMREWIADCQYADLLPKGVPDRTARDVVNTVARYYTGGVERFLAAGRVAS